MSVTAASIVQLRQRLREKFPGLKTRADELPARQRDGWPSGIPQLDTLLGGGLPKSALTEIVAPRGSGSALLLLQLLRRAAAQNQFVALIDGRDSFDAAAVEQPALEHLLWVRCHTAEEAVKAADLVLRDGNLPVVLLDLALNSAGELRKIPAPTWYRFQRIVEESATVCAVLTPRAMVSPAEVRVTLRSRFSFAAVEANQLKLTWQLDFEVTEAGHVREESRKIA